MLYEQSKSIISKIAEFAQGDEGEIEKVAKFAVDNNIDMAFIGPEAPLGKGIVDELEKMELAVSDRLKVQPE